MFDTLIACTVAYYRAHPAELARYGAPKTPEEARDEAYQFAAWILATPPWNSPETQQRLTQERDQVHSATPADQARFFAAKNAAIVQLAHGEHA